MVYSLSIFDSLSMIDRLSIIDNLSVDLFVIIGVIDSGFGLICMNSLIVYNFFE